MPEHIAEAVKERRSPATFDDHYSQVRQFFRSLSPVEQDHVIQAYTFELGKCREQVIRERQLLSLANIDAGLCAAVAKGLGLAAPKATVDVTDAEPSPALSQLGKEWPVAGRVVGIIADEATPAEDLRTATETLAQAGIVPLVVAPAGGVLGEAPDGVQVQRTYLTARSTEFDAVIVAGSSVPAPDAEQGRDAKAGEPGVSIDPRVVLLLSEAFRHAKAIGAWGQGAEALDAASIPQDSAGVAVADGPEEVLSAVTGLLAAHRAWERFPAASVG